MQSLAPSCHVLPCSQLEAATRQGTSSAASQYATLKSRVDKLEAVAAKTEALEAAKTAAKEVQEELRTAQQQVGPGTGWGTARMELVQR